MAVALFFAIAIPIGLMQTFDENKSKAPTAAQRSIDKKNAAMQKSARNNSVDRATAARERQPVSRSINSYSDIVREQNAELNRQMRAANTNMPANNFNNNRQMNSNAAQPIRASRQVNTAPVSNVQNRTYSQQAPVSPAQQRNSNVYNNYNSNVGTRSRSGGLAQQAAGRAGQVSYNQPRNANNNNYQYLFQPNNNYSRQNNR